MDLEARVAALEAAVAALRSPTTSAAPAEDEEPFWLVEQIRSRHPEGAVVFGGTVTAAKGEVAWQWGVDSGRLLDQDWAQAAPILDALSHPVRLRLLQQVLNGVSTTADLVEDPSLGTTGQLHHHLRALVAAGWLQSTGRGQWAVAPTRAIPLLVVIAAAVS